MALLFVAAAAAQLPERNCMSDPFMAGCPGAEQARKIRELVDKGLITNNPVGLNLPGKPAARPAPRAGNARTTVPANAVSDTDWKRPRLEKPLAPDWPRWSFAPPDASVLVGMKLNALFRSPVLQKILGSDLWKQFADSPPPVDEVWLSVRLVTGEQPDAVMLMIGPALDSIAEGIRSQGATVCFLDPQSLLVGDWDGVNEALQRVALAEPGRFAKRAGELWARDDLWVIAGRQMIASLMPHSTATAGIAGASLGFSMQDKFLVDMTLTAATPAEAVRLAARFQKNPQEAGLGNVMVDKTASGVSVHAELDPDRLPEPLRRQVTANVTPLLQMIGPKNRAAKGVVIQGLDDSR